jgi:hypothetical protein
MTDPQHECLHPDVIAGWLSLTRWARILIPICVGIMITLAASAITLRLDVAEVVSDGHHATERSHDNRAEIIRLRTDLVRLERDNALRQTETIQTITRLETTVEVLARREDHRTGRTR